MRRHLFVALPLLALLATGCGGKSTVSGVITDNGQPAVADRESISLSFAPLGGKQAFAASVDKGGIFHLATPLPPGKYRISLVRRVDYSATMKRYPGWGMGAVGGGADRFGGAFQGDHSPLTVELKGGHVHLLIDVSKRTVTEG